MESHTRVITPTSLFTVLAPTTAGPLTIAPLVSNNAPELEYLGLASGIARGVQVDEVGEQGDVGSVMVGNPLDLPVLLYDGEQISGAKQDRIINLSVLIPARGEERVPVSCVEHGRWRRVSARFHSSDHTAAPSVRRGKAEALRGDPREMGRAQERVWNEVGSMSARVGAYSPTGAFSEIIATLRPRIDELAQCFALVPGQCGALVGMAGRAVCLDAVSRADVFADLWPRLLTGYAADAIDAPAGRPIPRRHFIGLLHLLGSLPLSHAPSVGLGSDVRGATKDLELTGLVHGHEVIQLSAYTR